MMNLYEMNAEACRELERMVNALDAEIAKVEAMMMAQQARLDAITEQVEDLLGTDLEHWGE